MLYEVITKDQVQHVEMAQDMAGYFNGAYGEVFVRPEFRLPASDRMAKVPGLDGEKMSKSYGNTIPIFAKGKRLKKAVNAIVTDSKDPKTEALDPDRITSYNVCYTKLLRIAPTAT